MSSRDYLAFIEDMIESIDKIIKDKYPDLPWRQMYGLRNFAVHEYHTIDPQILWEIAEDHLIENKIQLENLLDQEKINEG